MITTPLEYHEQIAVVEYLELLKKQKKIVLFTALPNNMFTKYKNQKRKQKLEGLRKGFPDLCIVTPRTLLFIEMKRAKKSLSTVSNAQKEWIEALKNININVAVCYGFDEARAYIEKHI